ncbi:hypothetical protein ACFPA8_25885 [Streptomyces ovatisporus]|uniref:Uncharacterized protein n=1 Tax=Streptomyces ovatisporus TaxID=1128682 RepID=A0ABV9AEY4_9ACTN
MLLQFCTSPGTRQVYDTWREDPRRKEVVPAVMHHRARTVYELTMKDVQDVCRQTEHALGEVRRSDGEAVSPIVNWHPDFAFTHMFHICMERGGYLPTYQCFRSFTEEDELGQKMLGTPARQKVREVVENGVPESLARSAMRWRVGNAYYSFLRETYTVVALRELGVDVRVHPLADALFRVDAWTGRKVLSLRVGNKKFREGDHVGRKIPAERWLADVTPPMEFAEIELRPATVFGTVHVPSRDQLRATASQLL